MKTSYLLLSATALVLSLAWVAESIPGDDHGTTLSSTTGILSTGNNETADSLSDDFLDDLLVDDSNATAIADDGVGNDAAGDAADGSTAFVEEFGCTEEEACRGAGNTYYCPGEVYPSLDGCNTCVCEGSDFGTFCTEMACIDDDDLPDLIMAEFSVQLEVTSGGVGGAPAVSQVVTVVGLLGGVATILAATCY